MKSFKLLNIFLIFILSAVLGNLAHAGISIQGTKASTNFDYTYLESADFDRLANGETAARTLFLFGQYSYIHTPLERGNPDGTTSNVVDYLHTLDLRGGFLLDPRWAISANVSMNEIKPSAQTPTFKFGDSDIQVKYRFTDDSAVLSSALIGEVLFPTGSVDGLLSSGTFGASLRAAMDYDFNLFRISANLGFRQNSGALWETIDYRSQVLLGLGLLFPLSDHWRISAEASGALAVPFKSENSPGEYYIGGQYIPSRSLQLLAGVSSSGFGTSGNDGARILGGLKLALFPDPKPRFALSAPHCANRPVNLSYGGRALSKEEIAKINVLPYHYNKESKSQIGTYQMGQMTGITKSGIHYVVDHQVVIAIDLISLPERKDIAQIDKAILKMKVNKISTDQYLGTEVLCWVNRQICSGELVTGKNVVKTVNPEFFQKFKGPVNQFFAQQYLERPVATVEKEKIYSGELTLDVNELLKGSGVSAEDLIFDAHQKTLYMVVADDTFVSNDLKLELTYTERQCN